MLVPNIVAKSIYNIDYEYLANLGITALMFDLDGTIIPENGQGKIALNLYDFFAKLQDKFTVIIVSRGGFLSPENFIVRIINHFDDSFIESIYEEKKKFTSTLYELLGIERVYFNVNKFRVKSYKDIISENRFIVKRTAMIGNSIDDIWVPNLIGLFTARVSNSPTKGEAIESGQKVLTKFHID